MDKTTPTRSGRAGRQPSPERTSPGWMVTGDATPSPKRTRSADIDMGSADRGAQSLAFVARLATRLLLVFTPVVLLALLAAIVGYVRLLHGPISLKVLAGSIERGIGAEFGDLSAAVDDAVLRLTDGHDFEFRLVNLRLTESDGSIVMSAPIAAVALDLAQIAKGQFVPRRVELIDARLSLSYAASSGLALSFDEAVGLPENTPQPDAVMPVPNAAAPETPGTPPGSAIGKRIDVARALADYTARARRGSDATSYLREIALKNASLRLEHEGQVSEVSVRELAIDLDHRARRSLISSTATIESDRGPWSLSLLSEDSEKTGQLLVKVSIRDFVPSAVGRAAPALALLKALDLPMAANASFELATNGDLKSAEAAIELGRGQFDFGADIAAPLRVDAGLLQFAYQPEASRVTLLPSTLKWGDSHLSIAGRFDHDPAAPSTGQWTYELNGLAGVLAAEEFGVGGIPLQSLSMRGRILTEENRVDLQEFRLAAQDSELVVAAKYSVPKTGGAGVQFAGQLSAATAELIKVIWPSGINSESRNWFGRHVVSGRLKSAQMTYGTGEFAAENAVVLPSGLRQSMSLTADVESAQIRPFERSAAVVVSGPGQIRINDRVLQITLASAKLSGGQSATKPLALDGAQFSVSDVFDPAAKGTLTWRSKSELSVALSAFAVLPDAQVPDLAGMAGAIDGKFEGQFEIKVPFGQLTHADPLEVTGSARITDVRSRQKIGIVSVQSGTIAVDLNEKGATANGDLILNGVLAKLAWKRSSEDQDNVPQPLTLTARLDNSDRKQLGIDVNDYVQGEVPVEVTIGGGDSARDAIRVRADLSPAELMISELAWSKPAGREAELRFEIVPGTTHKTELQNFKLTGDSIAVDGWIGLGPDNKVQQVRFPNFSLNVVGRLEVEAKRGPKNIWTANARGATFDGRDFFRSLFRVGTPSAAPVKPAENQGGLDLNVSIDNVIGHTGVSLRGLRMDVSRRAGRLTALNARGTLDGGQPLAALLTDQPGGKRRILADSTDAGQALKLVGFYPNMQGGRVRLEVDLDGRGAAEKTGVLWIDDFKILGDQVVAEVISGAEGQEGPAIGVAVPGQRRVVREVITFDRLKLPFAVGYGQFVIEESYLRGPVLGATMRGKVDYGAERVNIGGTYIPLQGLNNMLGGIPIVGQILSGPRGEGVFGITFAIQGPMQQPQVIVNPLSMVAPGIFREIFQMTNPNTKVLPRGPTTPSVPVDQRVRASSSVGGGEQRPVQGSAMPPVIDGWSSDTVVPTKKR